MHGNKKHLLVCLFLTKSNNEIKLILLLGRELSEASNTLVSATCRHIKYTKLSRGGGWDSWLAEMQALKFDLN